MSEEIAEWPDTDPSWDDPKVIQAAFNWQEAYQKLESESLKISMQLVLDRQRENKYLAELLTQIKVLEESLAQACVEIERLRSALKCANDLVRFPR